MTPRASITLLAVTVALSGGCASKQQALDITTVDGCMVQMKGVSAQQAKEIHESWTFGDNCSVKVNEDES